VTDEPGTGARPPGLVDEPLSALIDGLARQGRVPGAGSVAAVMVAMSSAVVAMAARSSAEVWPEAGGAVAQAEALRRRALPLVDSDARALGDAIALLEPETHAEGREGERRDFELGLALALAADVPLSIVQIATDVAALAKTVAESGSAEVRPDAVGAAVLAHGAARAAAHLVEINLATSEDDFRVLAARSLAEAAGEWAEQALAAED
jgi:formiminotetrahydrofolate cyclodeaminase